MARSSLTPEQAELQRKARDAGFDLTVSPERIIQAAISPPAASLRVTDATTDEELSAFIRGKRRGQHK